MRMETRILRELMKMSNVKMVLGNHEYMMLQALGCPLDCNDIIDENRQKDATRLWYSNGGKVTHSYWKRIRKDI